MLITPLMSPTSFRNFFHPFGVPCLHQLFETVFKPVTKKKDSAAATSADSSPLERHVTPANILQASHAVADTFKAAKVTVNMHLCVRVAFLVCADSAHMLDSNEYIL